MIYRLKLIINYLFKMKDKIQEYLELECKIQAWVRKFLKSEPPKQVSKFSISSVKYKNKHSK